MNYPDNNYNSGYGYTPAISQGTYAARTFLWMFLGLLTTFAVSVSTLFTGAIYYLCSGYVPYILAIAEIVVVLMLSARLYKISITTARELFFLYAILNGLTMSSLLVIYNLGSLIMVFGLTSLYFGVMAAYAWLTKADLSYIRPVLTGGLVILLVWLLLSSLLGIGADSRLMSILGVMLFVGFTAYDTQKIRRNYEYFYNDPEMLEKASVICALQLYLDYINLFLYVLRLYGKRRR